MKNKLAVVAGLVAFGLCQIPSGHSFYQCKVHYDNAEEFQQKFDHKDKYTNGYALEALFERQRGFNAKIKGLVLVGLSFPVGGLTYLLFKKEEDD